MRVKEWVRGEGFLRSVELEPPRTDSMKGLVRQVQALQGLVDTVFLTDGARFQYRMSNLAAASYLKQVERLAEPEMVLHLTCRDHTQRGVQGLLLGASLFGLESILVLAGDGFTKAEGHFESTPALIRMVKNLQEGQYLDGSERSPLEFCVGATVNPYAEDRERQLQLLAQRVEAGAQYILTQPVYHLTDFYSFVAEAKKRKIDVPFLPGILPLRDAEDAVLLRDEFKLSIPQHLIARLKKNPADGLTISQELAQKLREKGFRGVHFYARGKAELAQAFFSSIGTYL